MTNSRFQRLRPFLVPALLLLAAAVAPPRTPAFPLEWADASRGPDRPRRERAAARLHRRRAALAREATEPADGRLQDARSQRRRHQQRGRRVGQGLRRDRDRDLDAGDPSHALPGRLHQQIHRRSGRSAPRRAREARPRRGRQHQARVVEGPRERLHQDRESDAAPASQPFGRPDRPRLRRIRGRHARPDDQPGSRRGQTGQQRPGPGRRRSRERSGGIRAAATPSPSSSWPTSPAGRSPR